MSTQEKSGGTLSSAFTKGEYTYRRRGSAAATGDTRITDPKPSADLNIVDLTGWKLQVDVLVEKPVDSVIRR